VSDPVLALYCGTFDPLSPELNLIAYDDDDEGAPGMAAFKSSDALALTFGNTYTLVISTFRGSTKPVDNSAIAIGTEIAGDFGDYTVCLPGTAVVNQVTGGGGEACFVEITEGEPEGVVEGEGEGTVEGDIEGDTEGDVEGSTEGDIEGDVEGAIEGEGETEGQPEGEPVYDHSADYDNSGWLSLAELLRVIQLFNAGAYYCAVAPEVGGDAFALTPEGLQFEDDDCDYHSSDYREPFGSFQLSELLRTIQFFNLGGVVSCPGVSEDGFCIPTE
jgi:hypothetical protein